MLFPREGPAADLTCAKNRPFPSTRWRRFGKRRAREGENQFGRDELPLIRSFVEDIELVVSRTKTTNADEPELVPTEANFLPPGSTSRAVFVMS
jgi:hypothetical protein